jgi:hypothetical protein
MILTIKFLKDKFKEYNKMYFENKLKMCNFSLYSSFYEYARFSPQIKKTKARIWINKKIKWDEELLKNTLMHEMVHYYVYSVIGIKNFLFPHGQKFRRVCKEIKEKYDYEIKMGENLQRYEMLKNKKSLTILEQLEIKALTPLNYILGWLF